jgi:hypothetical protein
MSQSDPNTPEAPQKATGGPQNASEGPSGQRETLRGQNGAHAGAESLDVEQPRGPVDWARQQAAEREQQAAADPRQPAYDAVYAYIRELGDYMPPTTTHRNAVIWRGVHAALDAARVPQIQPPAHNAGPSVAECAQADDAHWAAKYAGEGQ